MMVPRPLRSGFSLIEALVVLAIGGMALAIIFSIGQHAGKSGFTLGRKAMAAADDDIALGDVRILIRSIVLRPTASFMPGVDQPMIGEVNRLEADVVMERATQCAPQGWAGRLTLTVKAVGQGHQLICQAGGHQAVLVDLRNGEGALSYSTDRQVWTPNFSNAPKPGAPATVYQSITVWVRFNGQPSIDVVEQASSGRPDLWGRPSDNF